jgi:hypothetical protein
MTTAVHRPRRLLGTACALVAAFLIAAPPAFFGADLFPARPHRRTAPT